LDSLIVLLGYGLYLSCIGMREAVGGGINKLAETRRLILGISRGEQIGRASLASLEFLHLRPLTVRTPCDEFHLAGRSFLKIFLTLSLEGGDLDFPNQMK
jgi:hypothetical protein